MTTTRSSNLALRPLPLLPSEQQPVLKDSESIALNYQNLSFSSSYQNLHAFTYTQPVNYRNLVPKSLEVKAEVYDVPRRFLASVNYQNLQSFAYPYTIPYLNKVTGSSRLEPIINELDMIEAKFSKETKFPKMFSRPLPPLPGKTLEQVVDSIYAEMSFSKSKQTLSLGLSLNAHKLLDFFEKLHCFLSKLEEMFIKSLASKEKRSFVAEKCYVKVSTATPLTEAEKALTRDEFLFKNTSVNDLDLLKKRLVMLKGSLEAMQFVLTGIVNNASKVFYGEYGEQLGIEITKPLSEAKTKLITVEKKLQELIDFQSEWLVSSTQKTVPATFKPAATQAVHLVGNRYNLFNHREDSSSLSQGTANQNAITGITKAFIK